MSSSEAAIVDQQCQPLLAPGADADEAEHEFQDWCSLFALKTVTFLMDIEMQLLMEADLLSVAELDYFYWHWDVILSTRGLATERMRGLAHKREQQQSPRKKDRGAAASTTPLPTADEIYVNAKAHMCKGQLRVLLSINLTHFSPGFVDTAYATRRRRFDRRFRSFQLLPSPAPLTYERFHEGYVAPLASADRAVDPFQIIAAATSYFSNCKQYLDTFRDKQQESKPLIKISCVSASDMIAKENAISLFKVSHFSYPCID